MIIPNPNGNYFIEDKLAHSLNAYIDAIFKYNQDLVLVFDGAEGAGKSELMKQVGYYCKYYIKQKYNIEREFSLNNIKFDLDDYVKSAISLENEKGHIHDLDESRAVANRKRSTSKGNIGFTNYLSECRSAGHIHLIALPAYHDLDSYIAIWRCSFLIHIEKYFRKAKDDENGVPIYELVLGTYKVYLNDSTLKAMYYHKMRYIYPRKCVFSGRFDKTTIIDEEAYESKKRESRAKRYSEEEETETPKKKDISKADILRQLRNNGMSRQEANKLPGFSRAQVKDIWEEIPKL